MLDEVKSKSHVAEYEPALREAREAALQARLAYAYAAAVQHYSRALSLARAGAGRSDAGLQFALLSERAACYERMGDIESERADLEAMAELGAQLGTPAHSIEALTRQSQLAARSDQPAAARRLAESALGLAQAAGLAALEANSRLALGAACADLSDTEAALTELQRAVDLYRSLGNQPGEAKARSALGAALASAGQTVPARMHLASAVALFRALGDYTGEADALSRLAATLDDPAQQRLHLERALTLWRMTDDRPGWVNGNTALGRLYARLGLYRQARTRFERAAQFAREMRIELRASILAALGDVHVRLGDLAQAERALNEGLELARAADDRRLEAENLCTQGALELARGQHAQAVELYRAADRFYRELGDAAGRALSLAQSSAAHLALGDWESARRDAGQAVDQMERVKASRVDVSTQVVWWQQYQVLRAAPEGRPEAANRRPDAAVRRPDTAVRRPESALRRPEVAWDALQRAYQAVTTSVARLGDAGLRRNYLNKITVNVAALEEFAQQSASRGLAATPDTFDVLTSVEDQLKRMLAVSVRISEQRDEASLLDFIMDEMVELSGAERSFLALMIGADEWDIAVARGLSPRAADQLKAEAADVVASVARSRQPVFLQEVGDEAAPAWQRRSAIVIPLVSHAQLIGVLFADNRALSGGLTPADIDLLTVLANQSATAIENARLYQDTLRANRELEQRVAERTAELADANVRLQREIDERARAETTLRRHNEYLAALHDTALGLISRLDLKDLLHVIVMRASQLLDTPHGFMYLLAEGGQEMERQIGIGVYAEDRVPRVRPGQGLTGQVWQTGRTIVVEEYDRWPDRTPAGIGLVHGMAGVPLVSGNRVVGVLALGSPHGSGRTFGPDEVELLERFAQLASIALDNARLFVENERLLEAARAQARRMAALFRIADAASAATDLPAFYAAMHRSVGELMDAHNFYIALYDEGRRAINFAFYVDEVETALPDPQAWETLGESGLGRGLTAYVIRTGLSYHDSPEKFADLVARGEAQEIGAPSVDWLGVPLKSGDRILGAMVVQSYTEAVRYTDDDLDLLTFVSQHVATALQRVRLIEETRRRVAELELVNSIGRAIAAQVDIGAVIDLVGEQLRAAFGSQYIYIALLDRRAGLIDFPYFWDGVRRVRTTETLRLGQGLTSRILESRQPQVINTDWERRAAELGAVYEPDERIVRSSLGVPILVGGDAIGVIMLQTTERENFFTDGDARLLSTIAANVGVAIENARLFAAESQRAAELAIVNSVGQALTTQLEYGALIELVGEQIRETFHAQLVLVALVDAQTNLIHFPYDYDSGSRNPDEPIALGEGLASRIIRSRQPLLINRDVEQRLAEWNVRNLGSLAKSFLGVPILVGDEAIGMISVQNTLRENLFSEADVRLLSTIAANVGVAIHNAQLYREVQRRASEMAALAEIGRDISATLDLQAVLERIARAAYDVFKAQSCYLRLIEPDGHTLRTVAAIGAYSQEALASSVDLGEGITGAIARSGSAEVINDPDHDARRITMPGTPEVEAEAEALMVAPILSKDRVIGVMNVYRVGPQRFFNQADLDFLVGLTRQASIAIDNAHLYEAERQRAAELAIVNQVGQALASQLELEALIELVGETIRHTFDAQIAYVALLDRARDRIEFPYYIEVGQRGPHGPIPFGQGFTSRIIQSRQPLLVNQAQQYAELNVQRSGTRSKSYLGVPILVGGEGIGAISVQSIDQDGRFTESDMRLLTTIAASVGAALENARLFDEAQRARQAAEEANASKSSFLANVSHELRTPLTSVLGFARIIKKRLQEVVLPTIASDDPRVRRAVEQVTGNIDIIVSEGERLTALINEVLDLAKIESGTVVWQAEPVNLADVIEQATAATQALFAHKRLSLVTEVAPDLPVIIGDHNRLVQVVINLISNAVKFTERGGVVCRARRDEGEVVTSVIDSGMGIAAADLPRVFDQFVQVGEPLTGKPQGSGLGLSICKQIVEHHGGRLWAESAPGQGSTFSFALPVASPTPTG